MAPHQQIVLPPRWKWIASHIQLSFGLPEAMVLEFLRSQEAQSMFSGLLLKDSAPRRLFVYYQPRDHVVYSGPTSADQRQPSNGSRGSASSSASDAPASGFEGDNGQNSYVQAGTGPAVLFATHGNEDKLRGKAVYFLRTSAPGCPVDEDIASGPDLLHGEVAPGLLEVLRATVETAVGPALLSRADNEKEWGNAAPEAVSAFKAGLSSFTHSLANSIACVAQVVPLGMPDPSIDITSAVREATMGVSSPVGTGAGSGSSGGGKGGSASGTGAAGAGGKIPPDVVRHLEAVVESWCATVDAEVGDPLATRTMEGLAATVPHAAGPRGIIAYWRQRMQALASLTEQLRGRECREVLLVLGAACARAGASAADQARSTAFAVMRRWKAVDASLTDASNEAKDNVKYLSTIDKFIDPLYSNNPAAIIDGLPSLLNATRMVNTIARYFNTPERMTDLFVKITHAMIGACKRHVASTPDNGQERIIDNGDGTASAASLASASAASPSASTSAASSDVDGRGLWSKPADALIASLEECLKLNEVYQGDYRLSKDNAALTPGARPFSFDEAAIFRHIDLYCRRAIKLIDVLATAQQFASLGENHLDGVEPLLNRFDGLMDGLKRRRHDLLAYTDASFDRDHVEFSVRVGELERDVQRYIDSVFADSPTIPDALQALRKFDGILARPALREDLSGKMILVLANYERDLSSVQQLYESQKHAPPTSRNLPPVAGHIAWARHLLRRIEGPMATFQAHPTVLSTRDAKRIIRTYNKTARALVAFEYLWLEAWARSIETAKGGLQATLLVLHPEDGKLYVNFDAEILQLIREAKSLDRLGVPLPESARLVLLQEETFKAHHGELSFILREYARITARIIPVTAPILKPALADFEHRLRPGLASLTWTSMSIDAYKAHVRAGLHRLEQLISSVNDIIQNRIETNLRAVSTTLLAELPTDKCYTLDEFVSMQEAIVSSRAASLQGKNQEAETAVDDLIAIVASYRVAKHIPGPASSDAIKLKGHYQAFFYAALLNSTKQSLNTLKKRLSTVASAHRATKRLVAEGGANAMEAAFADAEAAAEEARRPFFEVEVRLGSRSQPLTSNYKHHPHGQHHYLGGDSASTAALTSARSSADSSGHGNGIHPPQLPQGEDLEVQLSPSLADVQHAINRTAKAVLSVSRSVWDWGQLRLITPTSATADAAVAAGHGPGHVKAAPGSDVTQQPEKRSFFDLITRDLEVVRVVLLLTGSLQSLRQRAQNYLDTFEPHAWLWEDDVDAAYAEFAATNPTLEDFSKQLHSFLETEEVVGALPESFTLGALSLSTVSLKAQLVARAGVFKTRFAEQLHRRAKESLFDISDWIKARASELSRPIDDIDRLRSAMEVLGQVQSMEAKIFAAHFAPLHDTYNLLEYFLPHGFATADQSEADEKSMLNSSWRKLLEKAEAVGHTIASLQGGFRSTLLNGLKAFADDAAQLESDYKRNGPLAPGISAAEALERLKRFQNEIELRSRRMSILQAGESLFGLPITQFPGLDDACTELGLLGRLFHIHSQVESRMEGWRTMEWSDVAESIPQIAAEVDGLAAKCKALPRAVRGWDVYAELQGRLTDLQNALPLVAELAKPSLRSRHWKALQKAFGNDPFVIPVTLPEQEAGVDDVSNMMSPLPSPMPGGFNSPMASPGASSGPRPQKQNLRPGPIAIEPLTAPLLSAPPLASSPLASPGGSGHGGLSASSLGAILQCSLLDHREDIEEICEAADKELGIKQKIDEVQVQWDAARLSFGTWKARPVPVLSGAGSIVEGLEEAQLQLQTLLTMRHVAPFRSTASSLLKRLSDAADTLELWAKVQLLWCSLESVFLGGDIARQMPRVASQFQKLDRDWARVMESAKDKGFILTACADEVLRLTLPMMFEELEHCQKSLEGYLETKRGAFPRFYFVSNPVLLQILSQGSDPLAVQQYYEKIFDSISYVEHDKKDKSMIIDVIAREGTAEERIALRKPARAVGNIEDWLQSLLTEVRRTMKAGAEECAADVASSLSVADALKGVDNGSGVTSGQALINAGLDRLRGFVDAQPGQYALLGMQMLWTAEVEAAFHGSRVRRTSMKDVADRSLAILSTLSGWCVTDLGSRMNRTKIETLVTIQVHQRDVTADLASSHRAKKITGKEDFEWQKQARFYWRPSDSDTVSSDGACVVSITDVDFKYQYEYLGCKERLVITPLTDRCYITLAQALSMNLGGAPAGPAGTGKTETVKDLGRAIGVYVVVTNCSEVFSYSDCGKIFKGIAASGAWGCNDEFNRITLPVLSVVAQQVLAIQNARKANSKQFCFPGESQSLPLDMAAGIFITMNPGYAGRQELPENLKSLFRSVAMMVPDREIIMKVKLCSVGYTDFTLLARKFFICYQLAEQQLSQQKHYDFGLRNILSVLRTAGATKRENIAADEEMLLYRTLRDMNLSKLVAQDVPLFLSMLADLFPALAPPPKSRYPSLESALSESIAARGLIAHGPWLNKVIQLHETCLVRHGIMLTGPAGSGKSAIMDVLQSSLTKTTGISHRMVRLNPKAVTSQELFGQTDPLSGEWQQGIFAAIWEKYSNRAHAFNTWLVCDGPVDTLWIESLNTVLDDNKILTLASGDRIPMTENLKIMFENESLANASPATVSRAGIIYVSGTDLDWAPVLAAWINSRPVEQQGVLTALFAEHVGTPAGDSPGHLFDFVFRRTSTAAVLPCTRVALLTACTALLGSMLDAASSLLGPLTAASGLSGGKQESARGVHTRAGSIVADAAVTGLAAAASAKSGSSSKGGNGGDQLMSDAESQFLRSTPLGKSVERLLLYSIAWSIGGLLEPADRARFDAYMRGRCSAAMPPATAPSAAAAPSIASVATTTVAKGDGSSGGASRATTTGRDIRVIAPNNHREGKEADEGSGTPSAVLSPKASSSASIDTIYEWYPDIDAAIAAASGSLSAPMTIGWKRWCPAAWTYPTPPHAGPGEQSMTNDAPDLWHLLIPSLDSTRALALMGKLHSAGKPVLIVGGPGTAKTSTALMFFGTFDAGKRLLKRINFSSATQPAGFQESVEAELDKRGGKSFGPAGNKKMTIFIDDISMPLVNTWGDQPTNEIVRQLVESGGMYFRDSDKRGDFKTCEDLSYVAAMNQPTGGRNDISNRLKRQFFAFNMVLPSVATIDSMYGQMLRGRFPASQFAPEVQGTLSKLTASTIDLWTAVKGKMLPTPAKFHYIFNMRELSRVFQGVLLTPSDSIRRAGVAPGGNAAASGEAQANALLRLWYHECERVFFDRLTNNNDRDWYATAAQKTVTAHFGPEAAAGLAAREPYFVDFLRADVVDDDGAVIEQAPRVYEEASDIETIRKRLSTLLAKHNEDVPSRKLDLVLFDDALRHLVRISRVLGRPGGSALLVGVGGSGKQSLTRLAAYIARSKLVQITLTKSYNTSAFLDDLRILFDTAGHMRKSVTFLFTESEIKDENFLEYINGILMTGEVAGLFTKEELMAMAADLRPAFLKARPGVPDTPDNLKQFFIDCARDNLHVVLCMSPVNAKFADRARKFPGLISGCTLDWFLPWPEAALVDVARQQLSKLDLQSNAGVRDALVSHMGAVHDIVTHACGEYMASTRRPVSTTPKSFLSFLRSYVSLYNSKLKEVSAKEERVNVGLRKLIKGAEDVEAMKVVLAQETANLARATEEVNAMLGGLKASQAEAKKESGAVTVIKANCEAEAARIAGEKASCEADLAKALPFVEEAELAIAGIKPSHIVEMKAMKKPSDIIRVVLDGILILRSQPLDRAVAAELNINKRAFEFIAPSWGWGTAMMNDASFLQSIVNFAKDKINDETIELLLPYTELEEFSSKVAKAASAAAEGLCTWVRAMVSYTWASKVVKPKLEALQLAEAQLADAQAALADAESRLAAADATLKQLSDSYNGKMAEKRRAEESARTLARRSEQAGNLIAGLAGERARWSSDSATFADVKKRLVGDCAIACAFISYCGPFNSQFRAYLAQDKFAPDCRKRGVPVSKDLDIISFLVDIGTIGDWNLQGLPTDPLSIQNGILVTRSSRYPLLVDPQGQAVSWLRAKAAAEDRLPIFGTTSITAPNLRDQLEFCLSEGRSLIVTGVEEEVDPMLDPLLEKRFVTKGRRTTISIGDKSIDVHPDFGLFLVTRLPNPRFSPELQAKTTVVDFTVTMKGLEEQLLGRVIAREQKALEDLLANVLAEVNENTKALLMLDAQLLERLSSNAGNLLDDEQLIDVLANTKAKAAEVKEKLSAADETKKSISEKREQFRPVATRGSVLYFSMIEMSLVNVMYQTSLAQFTELFMKSMDVAEKASLASKRVTNIIDAMTQLVHRYVNRGLYEKDKLLFAFTMTTKTLIAAGTLTQSEVGLFVRGGAAVDAGSITKKKPQWMGDEAWLNLVALADGHPVFYTLLDSVTRNELAWKKLYEANEPEAMPIPDYEDIINSTANSKEIGPWLRLLLIRSLRMDRTLLCVRTFVSRTMGERYVEAQADASTMQAVYDECSGPFVPVIFLLSSGADPTDSIEQLAKKKRVSLGVVSMGQGQEPVALRALQGAGVSGGWVLLQNAELGLPLMEQLESVIAKMKDSGSTSPDFRLWISAQAHPKFPLGLLHMSTKVTNEPPAGLAAGLARSYSTVIDQDRLERIDAPQWRRLAYVVAFMHSSVQERRKFGPLGWCIPYEFGAGDLSSSMLFLEKHIYACGVEGMSWPAIRYMVADVLYGGRVTDDLDRRLLSTYADAWMGPAAVEENTKFSFLPGGSISADGSAASTTTSASGGKAMTTSKGASFTLSSSAAAGDARSMYGILDAPDVETYRLHASRMPTTETPELYGLHPNADLTFRNKEASSFLLTLADTQQRDGGAGGGGGSTGAGNRKSTTAGAGKPDCSSNSKDDDSAASANTKAAAASAAPVATLESSVLQKANELLSRLPADYRMEEDVLSSIKQQGGMNIPLNIFLFQETQRLQAVITVVRSTLTSVQAAIRGEVVMTPQLLEAMIDISVARPPKSWLVTPGGDELSWLSPTLGSWFSGLVDRDAQLRTWLARGRPASHWLCGYFNPQGFLTAVKQEVARAHRKDAWALNDVVYHCEVTEHEKPDTVVGASASSASDRDGGKASSTTSNTRSAGNKGGDAFSGGERAAGLGVYIHGLHLEGARWERGSSKDKDGSSGSISESEPKKLLAPMPVLWVTAIHKNDPRAAARSAGTGLYESPLYRYPMRTDKHLVMSVALPTKSKNAAHWTLRGVALLASAI